MKLKSLCATVALGLVLLTSPASANDTSLIDGVIINGIGYPSKLWVDFVDLVVLVHHEGNYKVLYVVGSNVVAYLDVVGEFKAYKLDGDEYVAVPIMDEDLPLLERLLQILGDIHNI